MKSRQLSNPPAGNGLWKSFRRSSVRRLRQIRSAWLYLPAMVLPPELLAQEDQAAAILTQFRGFMGNAFQIGLTVMLIVGYLTAAYMLIHGAVGMVQGREGATARFLLGAVVAIVMLMLTTFFVTTGQGQLAPLRGET